MDVAGLLFFDEKLREHFSSQGEKEWERGSLCLKPRLGKKLAKEEAFKENGERDHRDALLNHMDPFRMEVQSREHFSIKSHSI
ncbi:hypothetical protein SLA2020_280980 [Shorea laevis]